MQFDSLKLETALGAGSPVEGQIRSREFFDSCFLLTDEAYEFLDELLDLLEISALKRYSDSKQFHETIYALPNQLYEKKWESPPCICLAGRTDSGKTALVEYFKRMMNKIWKPIELEGNCYSQNAVDIFEMRRGQSIGQVLSDHGSVRLHTGTLKQSQCAYARIAYRKGLACAILDETQFVSGTKAAYQSLAHALADFRGLMTPWIFVTNFPALHKLELVTNYELKRIKAPVFWLGNGGESEAEEIERSMTYLNCFGNIFPRDEAWHSKFLQYTNGTFGYMAELASLIYKHVLLDNKDKADFSHLENAHQSPQYHRQRVALIQIAKHPNQLSVSEQWDLYPPGEEHYPDFWQTQRSANYESLQRQEFGLASDARKAIKADSSKKPKSRKNGRRKPATDEQHYVDLVKGAKSNKS